LRARSGLDNIPADDGGPPGTGALSESGGSARRPALSVVLPAFNEEGNVERSIRHAAAAVAPLVPSWEIVVVDDGSRDGTVQAAARLDGELGGERLRLVRHERNRGYGAALRSGFGASRGELVFYTDSDNQFDVGELAACLPMMEAHDAILGYRLDRKDPWLRRAVSAVFNALSSLVFGLGVRDVNCSFKLFRGDALRALPIESDDFFVDTELVARFRKAGWRLAQRGVHHYPRRSGRSTVRPRDVPRTLLAIARMWWRLRRWRAPGRP
jgi:dolichol-phosphate mannosyltransferase